MQDGLYVGLLSGTSVDGIDAALLEWRNARPRLVHTRPHPLPNTVSSTIHALCQSGDAEIERLGRLDRELGYLFADAALALLAEAGVDAARIAAIGSHGQTVRHRPPSAGHGGHAFTLQVGDPNTIAERTGITTVADFRRRDMAAGGEGAPLAPAFHAAAFGEADCMRAIVNIGGISNISLLDGTAVAAGFDSGPGNTLMDQWIARHERQDYDRDGRWAARGTPQPELLTRLHCHPYLAKAGPRSTGREDFNMAWLEHQLEELPGLSPVDVQATLAEFTAESIATAIAAATPEVSEVYLCGGGAHNGHLTRRLAALLPTIALDSTAALGIAPDWVEAALFAWLAARTLSGLAGNAAQVTGAAGPRVLGAVYPGRI